MEICLSLKMSICFSLKIKACWPSQLQPSQRKMPQPEIKYLAREVADNSHDSFGHIHRE